MEDIYKESSFLIKNEKYSLDIFLKYQTPNGISYKGITIYKKNCDINFLNEESLQVFLNKKENKNTKYNYICSLANIGLISISDLICFLYLTKNDVILLDDNEEYIHYKIKNLQYIILQNNEVINQEFDKNFENFKKFFIAENLFFSVCKHGNNTLNFYLDSSNNIVYNENFFVLFKQANAIEFITPLKKGFYKRLIINDSLNNKNEIDNYNQDQEKVDSKLKIELIIINKNDCNLKDLIDIKNILNEKESIQEINIIFYPNIINKKINFHFFSYYGELFSDYNYLYNKFIKNNDNKKIFFLTALENYSNNNVNSTKDFIDEKNKEKFQVEIINDNKKNNIKQFISEKSEKIKKLFIDGNEELKKDNNHILILSGSSKNSIFNLIEEIIRFIINIYFSSYINSINGQYKFLLNNTLTNIDNFFIMLDDILCKRMTTLYKLEPKFPKVKLVTNDYIKSSNINIKNNFQDQTQKKLFSIFILTYNVAAMNIDDINSINFSELLFPEKSKKYFESHNGTNKYPLFYIIGLEEVVNLNPKNILIGGEKDKYVLWEEKITSELQSRTDYILLCKSYLVGILFFLFVQASEVSKIRNIKNTKSKTGFYGQLGNKGSCFVEFEYDNKTYGFNNGHLPAGEKVKKNEERKNNLIEILNHKSLSMENSLLNLRQSKNKSSSFISSNYYNASKEFYMHDFYFIFGDLNFRVNSNIKLLHNWLFNMKFSGSENLNKNNIDNNLDVDQLKDEIDEDNIKGNLYYQINDNIFMKYFGNEFWKCDQLNIFKDELKKYNIKENNITFPPTYKYIKNTNNYDLLKREPAWTDRILYKENDLIRSIIYDRIDINYSDHKPIFSIFEIKY